MTDPGSSNVRARLGRWLAVVGGGMASVVLIGIALWYALPWCAPEWTVRHAPTVALAARAALVQGNGSGGAYGVGFGKRVQEWGPAACPGLRRALADRRVGMRELAAFALVNLGHHHRLDQPTREALAVALDDANVNVRLSACDALVRLRDARPLPVLLAELTKAADWRVRQRAAMILGELGEDSAMPALDAACADPEEPVRQAAMASRWIMGKRDIGAKPVIPIH